MQWRTKYFCNSTLTPVYIDRCYETNAFFLSEGEEFIIANSFSDGGKAAFRPCLLIWPVKNSSKIIKTFMYLILFLHLAPLSWVVSVSFLITSLKMFPLQTVNFCLLKWNIFSFLSCIVRSHFHYDRSELTTFYCYLRCRFSVKTLFKYSHQLIAY